MVPDSSRPFDSIESAHEFVALLEESIGQAVDEVREHLAAAENDPRRTQALDLAIYKMNQLSVHMHKSRRILNDLRSIRRLLFQGRTSEP